MAKAQAPKKVLEKPITAEEKKKALDAAIAQIEKQFGAGSVMRMGEKTTLNVEAIPTGSIGLDMALGIGGLPKGRIIEIYGPESGGKTTVTLHAIAEAQKRGGIAAFVDVEHALDPVYAAALGVDVDSLLVSQPDTGEDALEIAEALIRSGAINKSNCVAIFINQLREKVGVVYGNPEVTPGGRALKFYSSVRIDIRRVETLKVNGEMIGSRTRAKVVKNKIAPPFKEAEFDIMYGEGISRVGELIDLAVKADVIQKSGAWFNYGDVRLGQGRDNVKELLKNNDELREKIEKELWANVDKLSARPKKPAKAAAAAIPAAPAPAPAPAKKSSKIDILVEE